MKKILLLVILVTVVLSNSIAKSPQKHSQNDVYSNFIKAKHNILEKNNIIPYNKKLVKASHKQHVQASKINAVRQPLSKKHSFPAIVRNTTTAVPDILVGTFNCKGVSYFGGIISGEAVIRADELQENKVWISNLIPGSSNQDVYGIVSADQKSLSIPQGQQIYVDGPDKAILTVFESSDPVFAVIDEASGVLTVLSDLWGAKAPDGWYDLFSGVVTYTRMDMLPPAAEYRQPKGGLFLGLVPDTWDAFRSTAVISAPFTTWDWKNTNIEEEVTYLWSYTDSVTGQNYTSVEDSLSMEVTENFYTMPLMTATNDQGLNSSFILGAAYQNKDYDSYMVAGGNATWLGFDENCDYGVADMDNGFTLLRAGSNSYYFGTGVSEFADSNLESLLVFYDEPLAPLYFEGVNVYLFVLDAPEETTFTMNVVLAEKDEEDSSIKGEIIASSTIKAKDATPILYDDLVVGYTLQFSEFENTDEDGFSVVKEYIEMDKAFFLELSGFNVPGVTLAVCSEEVNPVGGDSRSNLIFEGDESIYSWIDYRQTMYFNLEGAVYSYISLDKSTIYDDRFGGTYEVEVMPYFDTLSIVQDSIPDWLFVEITNEEYSDSKWGATLNVTMESLSEESEPRYFDIVLKTTAATRKLHINQGGIPTSNKIDWMNSISAVKNEKGFLISYPPEMKTMTLFSTSGAILGSYNLSESGKFELNDTNLAVGMYILELQGQKGSGSIKIMK